LTRDLLRCYTLSHTAFSTLTSYTTRLWHRLGNGIYKACYTIPPPLQNPCYRYDLNTKIIGLRCPPPKSAGHAIDLSIALPIDRSPRVSIGRTVNAVAMKGRQSVVGREVSLLFSGPRFPLIMTPDLSRKPNGPYLDVTS
jgi:hypothetical protein